MEILKLLIRVMTFLFVILMIVSCSPGWSVGGYELNPSDTTKNTVFIEIVAHDSTMHWYAGSLVHGENYCVLHNQWEEVRIK